MVADERHGVISYVISGDDSNSVKKNVTGTLVKIMSRGHIILHLPISISILILVIRFSTIRNPNVERRQNRRSSIISSLKAFFAKSSQQCLTQK
jgi:hypothetical protein